MQQRRDGGRPGPARRPRTGRGAPARTAAEPGRSATGVATGRAGTARPAAARPVTARRTGTAGAAKRTRAPEPNRMTGRAMVLALMLGALVLAYAYPVRIYLNQQAQIASLEASQAAQRKRIADLANQAAEWNDDNYKRAQIKKRLQMVLPGELLYSIGDPSLTDGSSTGGASTNRVKNTGPWYDQLWSSVQAADHPQPTP